MLLSDALDQAKTLSGLHEIPFEDFLYLLSDILKLSKSELKLKESIVLSDLQKACWKDYSARRVAGEPSQYITGTAWFYGLELQVASGVLIPRPETEGLVELALNLLNPNATVLDIGTGSGAIAIALKHNLGTLNVHATDISPKALEVAGSNAFRHRLTIDFHQADLFPDNALSYDMVISNPPYIKESDYYSLPKHILVHEPKNALLAGDNGLEYYHRILIKATSVLSHGAYILFEIGYDQADAINYIAKNLGITKMETRKDLAGHDRYQIYQT